LRRSEQLKKPVGAELARDGVSTFNTFVGIQTALASKLGSYKGAVFSGLSVVEGSVI
jgi:hypothetical protein